MTPATDQVVEFKRTKRYLPGGVFEIEERWHVPNQLSNPLTAKRWAELFDISRNRIVPLLKASGGVAVGEGNATRWRIPLSLVPAGYWKSCDATLHKSAS